MFIQDLILFVACLVLFHQSQTTRADLLPNQPPKFAARSSVPKSFLAYSFRQSACQEGTITSDVGSRLDLTRLQNATSCPSQTVSSTAFNNARIGVTLSNWGEPNAIKSSELESAFAAVTSVDSISMSVEIWFSFVTVPVIDVDYTLLEIGKDSTTAFGSFSLLETQFRIAYRKRSIPNTDRIRVRSLFRTTEDNVLDLSFEFEIGQFNLGGTAISSYPLGQIFMMVITFSNPSNNIVAVCHLARPEDPIVTNVDEITFGSDVKNFEFPTDSRLRVGSSAASQYFSQGFPGSIHFLAFYNTSLNTNQVETLSNAGLPNSLPVVQTASVFLLEDTNNVVNLNQSAFVFDVDGDPIIRFRIRSTPLGLRYNNNLITGPIFEVINSALLTFQHNLLPNEFSVVSTTTECVSPLGTFFFDASDGLCDHTTTQQNLSDPNCNSPKEAVARICVKDTQDLPTSEDVIVQNIRAGSSHKFEFGPTDLDDFQIGKSDGLPSTFRSRDSADTYVSGTAVKFSQTTDATFGDIVYSNGTNCLDEVVPANAFVTFTVVQQSPLKHAFVFCFRSKSSAPIGQSITFSFQFRDGAGGVQATPAQITFQIVNPVSACVEEPIQPPAGVPCRSGGDEGTLIPIYLAGTDALGRTLKLKLTSLPTYGTLYRMVGQNHIPLTSANKGALIEIGEEISYEPVFPVLVYEPKPYYFNRVSYDGGVTFVYKNKENQGIDGCIAFGSCRCPITTGIGCPDTFKYQVLAGPDAAASGEGVYNVLVNGIASPFLTPRAPENFTFTPPDPFYFLGAETIEIIDPDDSTYAISLNINPVAGCLGWTHEEVTNESDFKFFIGSKSCLEDGCDEPFEVYASTGKINNVLSTLFYDSPTEQDSTIRFSLYKPRPIGTTEANKDVRQDNSFQKRFSVVVLPPETAEGNGGLQGLELVIYAVVGSITFLAFLGLVALVVWLSLKATRKVRNKSKDSFEVDLGYASTPPPGGRLSLRLSQQQQQRHLTAVAEEQPTAANPRYPQANSEQQVQHPPTRSYPVRPPPRRSQHVILAPLNDVEEDDSSIFEWEKHVDPETRDVFFHNPQTGVSQWNPPAIKRTSKRK